MTDYIGFDDVSSAIFRRLLREVEKLIHDQTKHSDGKLCTDSDEHTRLDSSIINSDGLTPEQITYVTNLASQDRIADLTRGCAGKIAYAIGREVQEYAFVEASRSHGKEASKALFTACGISYAIRAMSAKDELDRIVKGSGGGRPLVARLVMKEVPTEEECRIALDALGAKDARTLTWSQARKIMKGVRLLAKLQTGESAADTEKPSQIIGQPAK